MIKEELAAKFDLPPLKEYQHSEEDYYYTFLFRSDYVILKAMEATLLGKKGAEDITEVLQAREYARQMINNKEEAAK